MGGSIGEALEGQLPEGGHVGAVAGHEEELGGALGPRVEAQLHVLVIARGPVAATTWT